jgi:hypothetical protein
MVSFDEVSTGDTIVRIRHGGHAQGTFLKYATITNKSDPFLIVYAHNWLYDNQSADIVLQPDTYQHWLLVPPLEVPDSAWPKEDEE